ncbi:uncharacterized protein LY79DRAFT_551924 [Colletotrichum navitas]|uniref:Uncharacterized protein n=1 Tax=Colletotrichum navitas TaxID=681940 RepID=A0AAD8Q0D5_9PEZI|nr:uncharacterized protein LY79DRAFT_551924 [Colletotrichum navitas]KAK1593460.1 hypothetical protein LY79DRAFT_551924 [Colletotrichum navitas]
MCDHAAGVEFLGNGSLEAGALAEGLVHAEGVVTAAEPVQERRLLGRLGGVG